MKEFSFAVLWKEIKENQIYFVSECSIFKETIKLLKTRTVMRLSIMRQERAFQHCFILQNHLSQKSIFDCLSCFHLFPKIYSDKIDWIGYFVFFFLFCSRFVSDYSLFFFFNIDDVSLGGINNIMLHLILPIQNEDKKVPEW